MMTGPLFYTILETPFGFSAVVFDADSSLVNRVFLPCESRPLLIGQIRDMAPGQEVVPERAPRLFRDIQIYFGGHPIRPRWEDLNLNGLTGLQRRVLRAVAAIPYGQTRTYGDIARKIGHPSACRFVGGTMSRNPFPIVIPCHRVIRADGSLGGFGGGVGLKRRLLAFEKEFSRN
ncbi:MAG: methylated-DNA--[protein]-cysteine S-methyltransferase [Deltaproteobacteria bacterium]|nr:methylated-DNA--[protein]-cysteine S-methyltransferase [Deltaproteobacteria bacterium]